MVIERIVQDYEKDYSVLFPKDNIDIIITKLPSYPEGTIMEEHNGYYLVQDDKYKTFHDFFLETDLPLKKVDELLSHCMTYDIDIYDLYIKRPYALYHLQDNKGNPLLDFEEIVKLSVPTTFKMRLEEIKSVTIFVLEQKKNRSGSTCFLLYDIYNIVNGFFVKNDRPLLFCDYYAYICFFKESFYLFKSSDWKQSRICLITDYEIERNIYTFIKDKISVTSPFADYDSGDSFDGFASEQILAIKTLAPHDGFLSILTGGPGTGKTTILKEIVHHLQDSYPNEYVTMLAPTGRAAKRIKEVMAGEPIEISTIHKFLDFRMIGGRFMATRSPQRMNEIRNVHFIIIDEASMLSNSLFAVLLTYLDLTATKILLVGDVNQLPSIDAGCLLKDLISLGVYTVRLTENFRSDGAIVGNANKINEGNHDLIFNETFSLTEDPLDIQQVSRQDNVLILSPYRIEDRPQSTSIINKQIHDEIFKNYPPVASKFRIGDKVLVTQTRYADGIAKYVNGDIGVVISTKMIEDTDIFGDPQPVSYVYEVLLEDYTVYIGEEDLDYGYAITIHKSQGSEEDIVHLLLPEYRKFLTRKMLYTAVTRAKQHVCIHSTKKILDKIIANNHDDERETILHIQSNLE